MFRSLGKYKRTRKDKFCFWIFSLVAVLSDKFSYDDTKNSKTNTQGLWIREWYNCFLCFKFVAFLENVILSKITFASDCGLSLCLKGNELCFTLCPFTKLRVWSYSFRYVLTLLITEIIFIIFSEEFWSYIGQINCSRFYPKHSSPVVKQYPC